jgi:hypothetical protein
MRPKSVAGSIRITLVIGLPFELPRILSMLKRTIKLQARNSFLNFALNRPSDGNNFCAAVGDGNLRMENAD